MRKVRQREVRPWRRVPVALMAALLVVAGCGGDSDSDAQRGDDDAAPAQTIRVPGDQPTIQGAVDAAAAGDLVLIDPGIYHEAVNVTTDDLTIRGLDRNEVILDGEFELDNGIRVLDADGVAVENMTARNYTANGFFWTGVEGYRASYLTSYRTGDYGIYAFDSVKGEIEHSYTSGSPDAGVYIGQCFPCDALIYDVISEHNGLGYSGTNSGGNLLIVESTFRYNRVGVVPNSGSYELCYPGRQTTIVGNTVHSNNQPDTPAIDVALLAMSNGILVAGGIDNVIERNLVYDHQRTGIGLVPFPEEDPNDDIPPDDELDRTCAEQRNDPLADPETLPSLVLWPPKGNRVQGNVVSGSGLGDLAVGTFENPPSAQGNCFSGNTFTTTAPRNLEQLAPCDGDGQGDWEDGALDLIELVSAERPPSGDYKATPVPPAQPNMPDAATAPPRPARDLPRSIDLAAIGVPSRPTP
jgi:hypothetical protein